MASLCGSIAYLLLALTVGSSAYLLDEKTKLVCAVPGAFFGKDSQKVPGSSADHCKGMCVPGQCVGWSFKMPKVGETQGTCYLKDFISSYDPTMGAYISGFTQKDCDGECLLAGALYTNAEDMTLEARMPYKTAALLPEVNHIACQYLCAYDTACNLWNYDYNVNKCEFYANATALQYVYNDAMAKISYKSGSKDCWEVCFMQGVTGGDDYIQEFLQSTFDPVECQDKCFNDPTLSCNWFTLKVTEQEPTFPPQGPFSCRLYASDAMTPSYEVLDSGLSVTGPNTCGGGAKAFSRKQALHSMGIVPEVVGPLTLNAEGFGGMAAEPKPMHIGDDYEGTGLEPGSLAPGPGVDRTAEELDGDVEGDSLDDSEVVVDDEDVEEVVVDEVEDELVRGEIAKREEDVKAADQEQASLGGDMATQGNAAGIAAQGALALMGTVLAFCLA